MPPMASGSLTLIVCLPRRLSWLGRGDVGGVVERCADGVLVLRLVLHVELVDADRERRQGTVGEEPARVERVVRRDAVDERLADDDDLLTGEPETAAEADREEHADESCVEHEVAGLAEVAALRRDRRGFRILIQGDAIAGFAEQISRRGDRLGAVRREVGGEQAGAEARHPGQPERRARRLGAKGVEMMLGARDDAADERDEQQQVDGREPRRGVDVEGLQLVEERREVGVVVEVLDDTVRVGAALRHERTRHGRDREQQQEEQRGAHARELTPEPAQPADEAQLRLDDVGIFARRGGVDVIRGPAQNL